MALNRLSSLHIPPIFSLGRTLIDCFTVTCDVQNMPRKPMPSLTKLGQTLRDLRMQWGLSLHEAAMYCCVGHFTLRTWEQGRVVPNVRALQNLSILYEVDEHVLFKLACLKCG